MPYYNAILTSGAADVEEDFEPHEAITKIVLLSSDNDNRRLRLYNHETNRAQTLFFDARAGAVKFCSELNVHIDLITDGAINLPDNHRRNPGKVHARVTGTSTWLIQFWDSP